MEFWINLGTNLLASAVWFILGILVTVLALKFRVLKRILHKIGINIPTNRPQLDLDLSYDRKHNKTNVTIKNAGNQAAYNVYVFLFEVFHGLEDGSYTISSLGSEKIRAGILAPNEKVVFEGKNVNFEGCNVTAEQEIWIEYTDELGDHYRTRIIPPNARGDDLKIEVPTKISFRMPRLPGLKYPGKRDYEIIRSGKSGIRHIPYL